jgi:hypothetical protein
VPSVRISPVEKLRRIWTPGREVEELVARLEPQSELDSMIRHLLHAICQQKGSMTINLDDFNIGTLRWEVIHHEPSPGVVGRREVTIWVEQEG